MQLDRAHLVEALTYGALSKSIEIPYADFPGRIRTIVDLRNRWAHRARLWNHSVLDAARVPNKVRRKAGREFGPFAARSIMDVIVSLDDPLRRSGIDDSPLPHGLAATIANEFRGNDRYWRGLTDPVGPTSSRREHLLIDGGGVG